MSNKLVFRKRQEKVYLNKHLSNTPNTVDQIQIQIQIHGSESDQIQIQIRRICICICKYKYVFDPSPVHSFIIYNDSKRLDSLTHAWAKLRKPRSRIVFFWSWCFFLPKRLANFKHKLKFRFKISQHRDLADKTTYGLIIEACGHIHG